ncbi:MAG: CocE/NonD family hydrolase [Candidatus Omnitrophota bacterium]|jgi:putative CocE/NonD family hydrolase|nr:MAG: CocE/NonD family hydrolase [Candidatus Omnitrophota bacterium]
MRNQHRSLFKRFLFLCLIVAIGLPISLAADYEVEVRKNVMIPMRDGVKLAANIFLPQAEGPFPTILMRTPYGKGEGEGDFYASKGYAYVTQDARGRFDSEGVWDPFLADGQDGFDTQEWIGAQSWCNGKIGTTGGSYVGFTQWTSAPYASKYLKTMVPVVPLSNPYHEGMYVGGAFQLSLSMGWGTLVTQPAGTNPPIDWPKAFLHLPLQTWDTFIGREVGFLRDWVAHPTYDEYWKKRGVDDRYGDIAVPILNIGGWYDIFSKATLDQVDRVRHESKNFPMRRNQFAVIGPWTHGISRDGKVGEMDFSANAVFDLHEIQFKWFEYWLNGKETGVEDWPPYYLFIMGENQWRGENEWPLKRTQFTNYYLHSKGKANSRNGDGVLNTHPPLDEPADTFVYNPDDPAPTHGGNNLFGPKAGPYDQSTIEEREDVLVYTSEPLNEALEVTGPVKMVLHASTSAKDTDFTAKLVDVHPDGKAINLCDGILRARFRESFTDPTLIQPHQVYRYEIDLWVTSNVFLPGHRIRVELSGSNFPRFDRNPNTGNPFGSDTVVEKATQIIQHNEEYPSHLVLPVIPKN